MQLTGAEIIIECLKEQKVDTVFGYPGGAILNVYDALYKHSDEIHHVLTSHEQGASHAADGYARATGKVGVCLATSGPGATNLVTGIATAYMDSVPVVAITANVGKPLLGRDSFQEVDIAGIVMPVTKHSFIVKDISMLADTLRKAFYIAKSGRPGPVLVDVTKDVTAATYEYSLRRPATINRETETIRREDLETAAQMIEEAKKRDHRKLGKELGLFMMSEDGPGFPFFLPKGMDLKNALMDYWREIHRKAGYVEISTPIILNRRLWETSGHWDHYKENMYTTVIDDEDYAIKPMNCPGGVLVYKSEPRSYRDLPLRLAEVGLVHRHEKSGQLHGLMRVRCFNQDDAHIFMTPEQIKDEIKGVANLIDQVYKLFGFKYHVELSTRPEDSMGSDEDWEVATEGLRGALDDLGLDYVVNEGDGAFYGPKIDFHLEDSIGRTWQCGTIQLDFQLPQRFELEYTGADGEKHRPIMIHRVVFGSIERFIGILIEHFAGAFPTWLAPVQVKILPISDKYADYSKEVLDKLTEAGIRAEMDTRSEKIGYKIREAQTQKIPYMLVVGQKEEEEKTVSVRSRFAGDEGASSVESFIESIQKEIEEKNLRETVKADEAK
mgnify:CR=1 FL=1